MNTLTVSVPDDLRQRLEALAGNTGKTLEECLALAIEEFVETWERHLDDVHQIDEHEARAVLKAAVNE
jgi:predicted transcriptional regulator